MTHSIQINALQTIRFPDRWLHEVDKVWVIITLKFPFAYFVCTFPWQFINLGWANLSDILIKTKIKNFSYSGWMISILENI